MRHLIFKIVLLFSLLIQYLLFCANSHQIPAESHINFKFKSVKINRLIKFLQIHQHVSSHALLMIIGRNFNEIVKRHENLNQKQKRVPIETYLFHKNIVRNSLCPFCFRKLSLFRFCLKRKANHYLIKMEIHFFFFSLLNWKGH